MWVGDPEDWAVVRQTPRPPLVCPEPGCDVELISCENRSFKQNPRFFRFKSVDRSCDHWADHDHGDGPETAQHEWVKHRLTTIARRLGYTATPEHPSTRADVFVHEPGYCLEVQLRSTQFQKRTQARETKGGTACWWIVDGVDSKALTKALFTLPAVRFRVIDKTNPRIRTLNPWTDPEDQDLASRAHLQVFATVAHPPSAMNSANPRSAWFRTGTMDGYAFLREVLSGRRRWYPPHALGHPSGLWALDTDVDRYRTFRAEQQALKVAAQARLDDVMAAKSAEPPLTRPPTLPTEPPTVPIAIPQPAPLPPHVQRQPHQAARVTTLTLRSRPRKWWQFWRAR
ncbi:hypothetical protein [Amycolatopsis sp. WAC 04197]|uniref:competence protein CoiA family protein n=1 Tax=Amycolatopsis sp. WAC 04197 TaxID=2203199 RepID=UPI000F793DAD|nr:hypothetical protein [Amycolatopsis sp. WAC 04197]